MFSIIEFVKETKKTDLEVRLVIRVQEVSWTHFNYFHFFSILRVINIFCSNAANFQVSSSQLCPRIGTRIFCPNPNGRPLCTVGLWPERRLAGAPFLPTILAVALTTLLPAVQSYHLPASLEPMLHCRFDVAHRNRASCYEYLAASGGSAGG